MLFICAYLLSGTRQRGKRDDDVWPEKALNCWMFECKPACAIQLDLPFSSIELLRVYLIGLFCTFLTCFFAKIWVPIFTLPRQRMSFHKCAALCLFLYQPLLNCYLFLAGKIVRLSSARFCQVAVGHCLIRGCRELVIINIRLISGSDFFFSPYKTAQILRPSYGQLACIHVTVISAVSKGSLDACLPTGIDEICTPSRFFEVNRRGVQKTFHKARSFAPDVLFNTCWTLTAFTRDCL